jgi:transcriptional regulator with XRE-family HTH domain
LCKGRTMSLFSTLLRHYVDTSGIKQPRIATDASISTNYLHRLLAGSRNPTPHVVEGLARALHLTAQETGELFAAAGMTPPVSLLHPMLTALAIQGEATGTSEEEAQNVRFARQCYQLAQTIQVHLRPAFLTEMDNLLTYAHYKYNICGGSRLLDLQVIGAEHARAGIQLEEMGALDTIATLIGELWNEPGQVAEPPEQEHTAQPPTQVTEMLANIDQLAGSILSGEVSTVSSYPPLLVEQIREVLRLGVPWEIRRRIAEALPGICAFDTAGACQIMEALRLDNDKKYEVDIRRRIVEAQVALFETDPSYLPTVIGMLHPQKGDDIYVALATVEACGDIQARVRQRKPGAGEVTENGSMLLAAPPLSAEQKVLSQIQRQLLLAGWDGVKLESLQYSVALYDLLCAPDALLISIRDGVDSTEKLMQYVAARYLERVLSVKPTEALQVYTLLLATSEHRNVRRTVARALPSLLRCMNESSLPVRTLTRTIIVTLAADSDIHIRRTVADYAMQLFHIDREFLLTLLRRLTQDRDEAIRYRLHPVVLRLAEVWLVWYAETAGLVKTRRTRTTAPFGE